VREGPGGRKNRGASEGRRCEKGGTGRGRGGWVKNHRGPAPPPSSKPTRQVEII